MHLDTDIRKYLTFADDPIVKALERISKNKRGLVFVTDEHGSVEGIITDGDFRRWIIETDRVDLDQPAILLANQEFVHCGEHSNRDEISSLLNERIRYVPLLDSSKRLVAVALAGEQVIKIGRRRIGENEKTFVIAEIGNNHNGDIDIARQLVDECVKAGVDCVKFQMRTLDSLYRRAALQRKPEDLGAEYTLDLLTRFQLSDDELFQIMDYARDQGVEPLCTPWDEASLEKLHNYGVEAFKIASADLTNHDLLVAAAKLGKPLIVSTGMSTEPEIRAAIDLLRHFSAPFVLLQCNSTYPTPFQDINLSYMSRLRTLSGVVVGYSGHERGIEIPIAAVSLGAKVIEKHVTLDRNMEGNDHKISLLPNEFEAMVNAIRNVELGLGKSQVGRNLTQGELMNRENLGKSLVAAQPIARGEEIRDEMIVARSPGSGLPPYKKKQLIGRIAERDISEDDLFTPADLGSLRGEPKQFIFKRKWGIPVRFHDASKLVPLSNPSLLEFHLSYRDLEIDPANFLVSSDVSLVVHSPELFASDHIMDLCSEDLEYRNRSVFELNRVTELTRNIKKYFPNDNRPKIVVNVGGASEHRHMPVEQRQILYSRLEESLSKVDATGVELIPQTMPPFPWHFGGQRFHNLLVDPDEIRTFCERQSMRICLDVSHSKLACTLFGWSMRKFLEIVGPYVAHVHLADAEGTSGEGLQIGDGEIDFPELAVDLTAYCPSASFIPEIWQGHKNDGEGFWIALSRLEQLGF
jgi:sialic acid synthase SpsE/sugar phosphate isomerase/epimerase